MPNSFVITTVVVPYIADSFKMNEPERERRKMKRQMNIHTLVFLDLSFFPATPGPCQSAVRSVSLHFEAHRNSWITFYISQEISSVLRSSLSGLILTPRPRFPESN